MQQFWNLSWLLLEFQVLMVTRAEPHRRRLLLQLLR
jgi:hypothetical protein